MQKSKFASINGTQRAWCFYGMTFGLALLIAIAAPSLGRTSLMLTMLTPIIGVVIMLSIVNPEGSLRQALGGLGLTSVGWRGWPPAIIIPTILLLGGTLLMAAFGLTAIGAPNAYLSVADAVLSLIATLIFGTVLAMGEEIGWRGYMLPRMSKTGLVPAMLIVGFLHGVWHLPLLLLTDLYHTEGARLFVVPMFLVTLTLAGVFYGWLRIWSGSLWPAALAHGAVNTAWELSDSVTLTRTPLVLEYIGGESGVLMILGLLILGVILGLFLRRSAGKANAK